MLQLQRKMNESVIIRLPSDPETLLALAGQCVEVIVLRRSTSNASTPSLRLGIDGPKTIGIHRKETEFRNA